MSAKVPSPCPMSWSEMSGSDTQRHCDSCDHTVQNYSLLDPAERQAMAAQAKTQRVCAFGLSGAHGRLSTREELSQGALNWLRSQTRAAGAMAAMGLAVQPTACDPGEPAHSAMMQAIEQAELAQAMLAEPNVVAKTRKLQKDGAELVEASLTSKEEEVFEDWDQLLTLGYMTID